MRNAFFSIFLDELSKIAARGIRIMSTGEVPASVAEDLRLRMEAMKGQMLPGSRFAGVVGPKGARFRAREQRRSSVGAGQIKVPIIERFVHEFTSKPSEWKRTLKAGKGKGTHFRFKFRPGS